MKILVTGRGTSGSWTCRGEQLGRAMHATVWARATTVIGYDIAVIVKRVPEETLRAVHAADIPWVWDIVDAYPQPQASLWTRGAAIGWVQGQIKALAPSAVIWPNQRMREDCDPGLPGLVLPHHHRPGIRLNPIRPEVKVVGYEGAEQYLADWHAPLQNECLRRGWKFVVNPEHLADLDIVVAIRGGDWNGYVQKHWKSNVKLANAHGSGTPFAGQPECGYTETATGCEYWAHDTHGIPVCFDWLESQQSRELIHDRFLQAAFPVEQAAAQLKEWLHGL